MGAPYFLLSPVWIGCDLSRSDSPQGSEALYVWKQFVIHWTFCTLFLAALVATPEQ